MYKILFIDDDINRMSSHIEMIEREGYEVDVKDSVDDALDTFSENHSSYSLIILDIQIPRGQFTQIETDYGRKTGLVLLEKLKKINKNIPVIILSVVRSQEVINRTFKLGIAEYLNKPILPSKLVEIINGILSGTN